MTAFSLRGVKLVQKSSHMPLSWQTGLVHHLSQLDKRLLVDPRYVHVELIVRIFPVGVHEPSAFRGAVVTLRICLGLCDLLLRFFFGLALIAAVVLVGLLAHDVHYDHARLLDDALAADHVGFGDDPADSVLEARERLLGIDILTSQEAGEAVVELVQNGEQRFGLWRELYDPFGKLVRDIQKVRYLECGCGQKYG